MESQAIHTKIANLLNIQESRPLTIKEEKDLDNLKILRNRLDPEWFRRPKVFINNP